MLPRFVAATVAVALAVGLAACQPEPQPSPTGPVFASEEEAFAAAEETYRAYVDALNARRSDPGSSPDPQVFLIGNALEVDIDTKRQLAEAKLALTGSTRLSSVAPIKAEPVDGRMTLEICVDSTETRVINDAGEDVTPVDRAPISLLEVDFVTYSGDVLVADSTTKAAGEC